MGLHSPLKSLRLGSPGFLFNQTTRQPAREAVLAMGRRRRQAWADGGTTRSQTRQLDPPVRNLVLPLVPQSQHLLRIIQDFQDSKIHGATCTCRKPAEPGKKRGVLVSCYRPHQVTRQIFQHFQANFNWPLNTEMGLIRKVGTGVSWGAVVTGQGAMALNWRRGDLHELLGRNSSL